MEKFIGSKIVQAEPACRLTFQKLGGPEMVVTVEEEKVEANIEAAEESGLGLVRKQEGYKVVYEPDGYESWSPKEVFEAAYRRTDGLSFGLALEAAKKGMRIARAGWNGKGQYVELGVNFQYEVPYSGVQKHVQHLDMGSQALVFCGTRGRQVGWLASQADMLADDWEVLPEGTDMSWSEAEEMLKAGATVRRKGWKSGLWVTIPVYPAAHWGCVCRTDKNEGNVTVGWEPEDEDLAANDWYTVLTVPVTE